MDLVKKSIAFETPVKPGDLKTNHAWRHTTRGGKIVVHKRSEYRSAQAAVRRAARKAADGWQLEGSLHVHITTFAERVHRKGAAAGLAYIDVDACVKGLLDALEHSKVIEDDAQVTLLTACKAYDPKSPGIAVHIAEIDEEDAATLARMLNRVTGGE
jgi:Holliday junction resolvase RusA-like endonuclease